jgi:hypothetical protein
MSSFKLKCISWNILADGMSSNEFMTNGGDKVNTLWASRGFRICHILKKFLQDNVQVIGLQENDHPYFILHELQQFKPEIRCIHLLAKDASRSADKLRLIAIYNYLNENDSTFRNATSNSNKGPQDFDNVYSRINDWYKTNQLNEIKKVFTMTSFKEEHSEILQQFLKRNPDDLYVVNDGVSIYYDSSVIEYVEPSPFLQMNKTEFPTLFTGHDLACLFKIRNGRSKLESNTTTFLSVICSHLKSGEGSNNEKRRVESISNILKVAKENKRASIILLDSNTSDLYRKDIEELGTNDVSFVDDVIHAAGFKNVIPTKGNECFKMRHARGTQPNKFGNLMFDTIDKILVKPESCNTFSCVQTGWLKTLPDEYYNEVLSWRVDEDKREKLKNLCCDKTWGDDMNKNDTGDDQFKKDILLQLYPNKNIPSDHPPVVAEITFKL